MIDEIIARLSPDEDFTALKHVAGALSFAEILETQFAVPIEKRPAAFVALAGEQAAIGEVDIGITAQIVTQTVSIAFCIGSGGTVGAEAAKDGVMTLRQAVLDRLLGWSPDGEGVLTYGGLSLLAFRPRVVWFQMTFGRRASVSN